MDTYEIVATVRVMVQADSLDEAREQVEELLNEVAIDTQIDSIS